MVNRGITTRGKMMMGSEICYPEGVASNSPGQAQRRPG